MSVMPTARIVEVFAPATIANLGAGFDILGMAVTEPYDTIHAERVTEPGVVIAGITGDEGQLSLESDKNTAGIAAKFVLDQLRIHEGGVRLRIHKGLPLASGLGSSAASAVGAAIAVNALFGNTLRRQELIPACVEAEGAVSGRHADNVAPALLGGIVLVTGLTPEDSSRWPVPDGIALALVTPAVAVPTAAAGAVLPKTIPVGLFVKQSAAVAQLVSAIYSGDLLRMGQAMEGYIIVEPAREHLMPGLKEVREAARKAGALATIISGAGPTLCSLCATSNVARLVSEAQAAVYATLGIPATTHITTPSLDGATFRVIEP